MIELQFLGQNLHFAIGLIAALATFAAAWLYYDAWLNEKNKKTFIRWVGFFILSVSFVMYAVDVPLIGDAMDGDETRLRQISDLVRFFGYLMIILVEIIDPILKAPNHKENKDKQAPALYFAGASINLVNFLPFLGSLGVSFMYARRAFKGLERHLKPLMYAFIAFSIFELLAQAHNFRSSSNVAINQAVEIYGPFWIAENLSLLIASLLLGRWVWKYLTKRFTSQLFMIFNFAIIIVFLATTLTFTFILLKGVRDGNLANLNTTANVLNYALDSKRSETIAGSEALGSNPSYIKAIMAKDHDALVKLSEQYLATKKLSSLIITSDEGQVLLRAQDPDRWGDSLSSDSLIRRSLIGQKNSSVSSITGPIAPTIQINSTVPVRSDNGTIVGTITSGVALDDAFVDGIKNSTGLEASIYSSNIRSATTTLTPDGSSRWVGIKEQNPQINDTVLKNNNSYSGSLDILNRPFLAVYKPLSDVDNVAAGMILVAQPQSDLLKTANNSIKKTFLLAAILLAFSTIPAYFVARYIVKQI